MLMHWTFSIPWLVGGIAVIIAGILIVKFHRVISDNLASGVSSYDKMKLFGIIAIVVGFIMATNLHSTILYFIFHIIMPSQFP